MVIGRQFTFLVSLLQNLRWFYEGERGRRSSISIHIFTGTPSFFNFRILSLHFSLKYHTIIHIFIINSIFDQIYRMIGESPVIDAFSIYELVVSFFWFESFLFLIDLGLKSGAEEDLIMFFFFI
ncbi:hypothetical protein DVH24_038099 [Malus domestica]|uniref:Uncharacterized protein n=1 Tax=Malus domestica TaxID=3750 RepID=A0A498KDC8_MALDO|nr:hypothetical protein DVH24_038099 [Malus domestica]